MLKISIKNLFSVIRNILHIILGQTGSMILLLVIYIIGTLIGLVLGDGYEFELIPYLFYFSIQSGWGVLVYFSLIMIGVILLHLESDRIKIALLFVFFLISLIDAWRMASVF